MDELFKTVKKGVFSSIPDFYSLGLHKVISAMLQTNPENRPSCRQMLSTPLFKKWASRISVEAKNSKESLRAFNITTTEYYEDASQLIKTIKMSEDLKIQEIYLPAPSYEEFDTAVLNSPNSRGSNGSPRKSGYSELTSGNSLGKCRS